MQASFKEDAFKVALCTQVIAFEATPSSFFFFVFLLLVPDGRMELAFTVPAMCVQVQLGRHLLSRTG